MAQPTMKDILARTRKRPPYGKVTATFIEEGNLTAAAAKLGLSRSETWRQYLRGLQEFVLESKRSMNVG